MAARIRATLAFVSLVEPATSIDLRVAIKSIVANGGKHLSIWATFFCQAHYINADLAQPKCRPSAVILFYFVGDLCLSIGVSFASRVDT